MCHLGLNVRRGSAGGLDLQLETVRESLWSFYQ